MINNLKKPNLKYSLLEATKPQYEFSQLLLNTNRLKNLENKVLIENPIVVLPGFLSHDIFYSKIRSILGFHCHNVYGWKQGFNSGFKEDYFKSSVEYILSIYKQYGKKVILIGHSLGGVYAKEIAKFCPDIVHSIYTFGSPLLDPKGENTPISFIYNVFNSNHKNQNYTDFEKQIIHNYLKFPETPFSSFYSKKDGIVYWESSILPELNNFENIECDTSHCGMLFEHKVVEQLLYKIFQYYY
jgi:pimeloyl-ACP methyl ester carboxylesterase